MNEDVIAFFNQKSLQEIFTLEKEIDSLAKKLIDVLLVSGKDDVAVDTLLATIKLHRKRILEISGFLSSGGSNA